MVNNCFFFFFFSKPVNYIAIITHQAKTTQLCIKTEALKNKSRKAHWRSLRCCRWSSRYRTYRISPIIKTQKHLIYLWSSFKSCLVVFILMWRCWSDSIRTLESRITYWFHCLYFLQFVSESSHNVDHLSDHKSLMINLVGTEQKCNLCGWWRNIKN